MEGSYNRINKYNIHINRIIITDIIQYQQIITGNNIIEADYGYQCCCKKVIFSKTHNKITSKFNKTYKYKTHACLLCNGRIFIKLKSSNFSLYNNCVINWYLKINREE